MEAFKIFTRNLGLSLWAYFIMSFLGVLCQYLLDVTTRVPIGTSSPQYIPWWVEIILWIHVLGSVAFYFHLGTRLKLIGSHLLNFFSVSGGLTFGTLLIILAIYFNPYLILFGVFSFMRFTILLSGWLNNEFIAVAIVSVLPTIIIWLAMLYKNKISA